jgi:hypothetical protein
LDPKVGDAISRAADEVIFGLVWKLVTWQRRVELVDYMYWYELDI